MGHPPALPSRGRPKSSAPFAGARLGRPAPRPPALHSNLLTAPVPEPLGLQAPKSSAPQPEELSAELSHRKRLRRPLPTTESVASLSEPKSYTFFQAKERPTLPPSFLGAHERHLGGVPNLPHRRPKSGAEYPGPRGLG